MVTDASMSHLVVENVPEEITLFKAMEICLKYPEVQRSSNWERHRQAFEHLLKHFGPKVRVKDIWIPHIKEYQVKRLEAGAAPSTINKEKAALSIMFRVLMELRHIEVNPARMVKYLSESSSRRQAYISYSDFQKILACLPEWFRPVALTAYYTGMRRGEILNMTRSGIKLSQRLILLGPEDTKERDWKRVPIHKDLLPVLEELLSRQVVGIGKIFLHKGAPVSHRDQVRWCWDRRTIDIGIDPPPHFHDIRHTWKTNARRSGMHAEIIEAIMGHANSARTTNQGYGRISDADLVTAIDMVTFDHGETEILGKVDPESGMSNFGLKLG